MKHKLALILMALSLIIAAQACQPPWNPTSTPTEPEATDLTPETPTVTVTDTPTEEPGPSLPAFPDPIIFNFSFFAPMRGWAITQDGNYLLVTVDGGDTWLDATPAALHPLPAGLTSLSIQPFFLDADIAWFTPNNPSATTGTLYHTQDGGENWTANPLPFNNARYFFLDLNAGFALVDLGAGAGSHYVTLYQTADGGATWSEVFSHEPGESKSLPESGSKSGITFLDSNHGWIGGNIPMTDYFYLYMTTDGGVTWAQETDIALPGAYAGSFLETWQPFFINNTVAYLPVRALAPSGDNSLLLYRSDDAGQTWVFQNSVLNGRVVDFTTLEIGWIAADMDLLATIDGGVNWSPASTAGIPPADFILNVDFVDGLHGWALTTPDDYTWTPLTLYRTTDGTNWTQILP